jgi:hypothetical protein
MDLVARKGHVGEWETEDDPHLRSRLQHGDTLNGAASAITNSSLLIRSAWPHFDPAAKVCTIELAWARRTTPEERSEVARSARAALRTWLGPAAEAWAYKAKERPQAPSPAATASPARGRGTGLVTFTSARG